MKKFLFLMVVFLIAVETDGFSQKQRNRSRNKLKAETVSVDSLEYKLVVLDPGFDTWMVTQPPENFYSKSFYEFKNRQYVTEWNHRYMTSRDTAGYDSYIDYDFTKDYGLDLNYRLYYYFKYFEKTNGVSLYPGDR